MAEAATPPRAEQPGRAYRVLKLIDDDQKTPDWTDFGEHPGSTPEQALKHAEAKHQAELKKKGITVVAVAASSFRPLRREEEMVPKITYKPLEKAPQQETIADA